MTQFLRDQASDNEEVVTPIMLDGTYLSRNLATFGPLTFPAAVCLLVVDNGWSSNRCQIMVHYVHPTNLITNKHMPGGRGKGYDDSG